MASCPGWGGPWDPVPLAGRAVALGLVIQGPDDSSHPCGPRCRGGLHRCGRRLDGRAGCRGCAGDAQAYRLGAQGAAGRSRVRTRLTVSDERRCLA